MYIEPNSTIKVLRGIPWDNTYQHTPRFASRTAQTTYMNTKVAFTLGKHTYVREGRGYLRVEKNVEELIGCNYLMFQNPKPDGTMGKVFYAFITAAEYVNPITTEIRYEIDVMQTWFLDCKLGQCFIERSHSATDNIGDNLVAEDFAPSEYIVNSSQDLIGGEWCLAVCASMMYNTTNNAWEKIESLMVEPCMTSGTHTTIFPNYSADHEYAGFPSADGLSRLGELVSKHPEALVGIYYVPKSIFAKTKNPHPVFSELGVSHNPISTYVIDRTERLFEGGATQMKNKKMFTYPYAYLELSNHQDEPFKYKLEMFNRLRYGETIAPIGIYFEVTCDTTADPTIMFVPKNYKGLALNYDEIASLTNLPFMSFTGDVYKQWLARNKTQQSVAYQRTQFNAMVGAGKSLAGIPSAVNNGDFSSMASGAIQTGNALFDCASLLAKEMDMLALPGTPVGGKGACGLFNAGGFTMTAKYMSISYEQAKRIDDFFTVFGYAQRCAGTPNITSRPYWNYIKLVNPSITPINGGVPADDVSAIVKILTNGITFWHNANNIGNYSLDNSV